MENKNSSKQLLFLEPINEHSDEDELIKKLIKRLEALGFDIIDKQEGKIDEN